MPVHGIFGNAHAAAFFRRPAQGHSMLLETGGYQGSFYRVSFIVFLPCISFAIVVSGCSAAKDNWRSVCHCPGRENCVAGCVVYISIIGFSSPGSSYISAYTYGLMHRLHHAHTDQPEDPHSPHNDPNPFLMMWTTRTNYFHLYIGKTDAPDKYKKNLPDWERFDRFAHNYITRILWIGVYIGIYALLATAWWQWLFLPATIIMGSLQGMAVNWWAHKFGYENYTMSNTSKNILPVDLLFMG
ncbi:Fatty acid desaturase, type 1 [Corchorus olitorius]|uniref:Fatty acid desaturase, type 1 n=1 Tax=Corchorus olitorius TaxID=93759 RepID=A0A1R3L1U6_9ROSI|nr:Fatty acid desaturase, type 1 [Corchorus olitorius]